MSQLTFANFVGINAASLSNIFNNRTKPTLNIVEAIKNKIPNLNTDWLMFGNGSMFMNEKPADAGIEEEADEHNGHTPSGAGTQPGDLFTSAAGDNARHAAHRQQDVVVRPEIRYVERPQRQITEIRVYFDDLTYESFVPKK